MMILSSFLYFLPSIFTGSLIVHLLWRDERPLALLLKFSLGIGMGLGINSIFYFVSLLAASGKANVLAAQLGLAVVLLGMVFLQKRGTPLNVALIKLTRLQTFILVLALIAFLFSVLSFFNAFDARPQGAFDAWSIWNRAARFIYRDPENWTAALSPELHGLAHADYPLLVPLNAAWAWSVLGTETSRAPMGQGFLFFLASIGTMFSSTALSRTIGQAGLSVLVLLGSSMMVSISAALVSDIPVAYFILASSVLSFFYFTDKKPAFLVLAGFAAGLAAWSKNEGLLFAAAVPLALTLAQRGKNLRLLAWYFAGLAIPLAVVVYHKSIAPPSELLAGEGLFTKLADPSRYWLIAKTFGAHVLTVGGFWPVGSFVILFIYGLLMRARLPAGMVTGLYVLAASLALQLTGYFAIYLITPYELEWHMQTSINRLLFQLYPTALFLFFNLVSTPEDVFTE